MLPVTKSDPATVGPPMSVQLQLAGQPLALTGVLVAVATGVLVGVEPLPPVMLTPVKATVLNAVGLCAVTARPASSGPKKAGKLMLDPGISVQVTPSLDV
jgi:hypothetical protein